MRLMLKDPSATSNDNHCELNIENCSCVVSDRTMLSLRSFVIGALCGMTLQGCPGQTLPAASSPAPLQRTFSDWTAACARLPSNRKLEGRWPPRGLLPLPSFAEFDEVLDRFFAQCKNGSLGRTNLWLGKAPAPETFFNTRAAYFLQSGAIPFEPFAEKLTLPEGSEVFVHADFHGDLRSLLATLNWLNSRGYLRDFQIARTNFHMVFLGDYTDRGAYGVEVLYTLLRLKLANPEKVLLLRGNHEDVRLQESYTFLDEGNAKYGLSFHAVNVLRAYDFFPVVLYLGCGDNFIQCNHGGLEPGFSPAPLLDAGASVGFQLLGPLRQKQYLLDHPAWLAQPDKRVRESAMQSLADFLPTSPTTPQGLGFMWNDFSLVPGDPEFAIVERRGVAYGHQATEYFLQHAGTPAKHLRAIFRGHQQYAKLNPMMSRLLASRGVFRHWQQADGPQLLAASVSELSNVLEHSEDRPIPQGSLWTFNVSPDSVYGKACAYDFDTFGILTLSNNATDWRLKVVNLTIPR